MSDYEIALISIGFDLKEQITRTWTERLWHQFAESIKNLKPTEKNIRDQRLQREIEQLSEAINNHIKEMFDISDLSDESKLAVAQEIIISLTEGNFVTEIIRGDASSFVKRIIKDQEKSLNDFSQAEKVLFERTIGEIAISIIQSAQSSPELSLFREPQSYNHLLNHQKEIFASLQSTLEIQESESPLQLVLQDIHRQDIQLSIEYLSNTVIPYLDALFLLQKVIDKIIGIQHKEPVIKSIACGSIEINLDGAAKATEIIRDEVTPWRREHSKKIAQLSESEKEAIIESKRAEILEQRAQAQKTRTEAKIADAEAKAKNEISILEARAKAEKLTLENEKLRLELAEKRIDLALKILDRLSPELSERQKIQYSIDLLQPLQVLTESPLSLRE